MLYYYYLLLSSLLAILICRLIVFKILKKTNPFIDKFCNVKGNFNCDAVLESPISKFSKNIYIADIGLVYFSAQLLFLISVFINQQKNWVYILIIPATIAFMATLVLLWYQWRVIKSWCKLCLLLTSIIWLQFVLCLINLYATDNYWVADYFDDLFSDKTIALFLNGILFTAITSAWFFIKPQILKANEVETVRKQIARWKNSVTIFNAVLQQQKKIADDYWEDDLLLGNPNAEIKMIAAISTYCPACAKEFKRIAILLKTYPNDISFTIRFSVQFNKINNKTQAAQYLYHACLQANNEQRLSIVENWFKSPDLNKLKVEYKNVEALQIPALQKSEQWFKDAGIKQVPTLFINGFPFPQPYNLNDLKTLLPKLLAKKVPETV